MVRHKGVADCRRPSAVSRSYSRCQSRILLTRFVSFGSVLAVCFCLFTNGCFKGMSRATAATVFFTKGNVVFGNAERNRLQPVTSKSKIRAGDTVRTSEGASINLALMPGAFIQVSENSEVTIEYLGITKDGNETAGGVSDRRATYGERKRAAKVMAAIAAESTGFSVRVARCFALSAPTCRWTYNSRSGTSFVMQWPGARLA